MGERVGGLGVGWGGQGGELHRGGTTPRPCWAQARACSCADVRGSVRGWGSQGRGSQRLARHHRHAVQRDVLLLLQHQGGGTAARRQRACG